MRPVSKLFGCSVENHVSRNSNGLKRSGGTDELVNPKNQVLNLFERQNLNTNLIVFNLKVCLKRDKQYDNRFLDIVFVIKVGA